MRDYRMWAVEFPNGERRECRSLWNLLRSVYEPYWLRRILNTIEDLRYGE